MTSEALQKTFRRAWWALLIRGVLSIALGIFIMVRPLESVAAFALVIAIWALVNGITEIVHSFSLRAFFGSWWVLLLGGLVSAAFGLAALYYYPALSLVFAVTWISFWLLLSGVLGITAAVQQRRLGLPWGWVCAWGVVSVLTSIAAFLSPPVTLVAIMGLMAGFGIVSGVTLLIGAFRPRSLHDDVSQAVHSHSGA